MKSRGRLQLVFLLVGALFLALPHAPVQADLTEGLYGCERVIHEKETGELNKETDPPDGSTVMPGQTIHAGVTWSTDEFESAVLHKVLDCVTVDGKLDP